MARRPKAAVPEHGRLRAPRTVGAAVYTAVVTAGVPHQWPGRPPRAHPPSPIILTYLLSQRLSSATAGAPPLGALGGQPAQAQGVEGRHYCCSRRPAPVAHQIWPWQASVHASKSHRCRLRIKPLPVYSSFFELTRRRTYHGRVRGSHELVLGSSRASYARVVGALASRSIGMRSASVCVRYQRDRIAVDGSHRGGC